MIFNMLYAFFQVHFPGFWGQIEHDGSKKNVFVMVKKKWI